MHFNAMVFRLGIYHVIYVNAVYFPSAQKRHKQPLFSFFNHPVKRVAESFFCKRLCKIIVYVQGKCLNGKIRACGQKNYIRIVAAFVFYLLGNLRSQNSRHTNIKERNIGNAVFLYIAEHIERIFKTADFKRQLSMRFCIFRYNFAYVFKLVFLVVAYRNVHFAKSPPYICTDFKTNIIHMSSHFQYFCGYTQLLYCLIKIFYNKI